MTDHIPLISIIMPTHNAARYIGEAVESVLGQTYGNWELIIVDDASADGTEEVVSRYNDARIRYHRVERIGHPAGVRNAALRMATGELIAFLDADDAYFPETLDKLSRPLRKYPRLQAVYGFAAEMDETGHPLPPTIALVPRKQPVPPGEPAYELPDGYDHSWESIVTGQISCLLAGLMLRREAREAVGFFNETLCGPEDYEYFVRLYLHDYDGVCSLPDYMYRYRIHAASLTKSPEHCDKVLSSSVRILDWLFDELRLPAHVHVFKSRSYTDCYRYLARERLLHRQPELCRSIVLQALECPHIRLRHFMQQCVPLLVRSYLPAGLDAGLVKWRWKLRNRLFESPMKPQSA